MKTIYFVRHGETEGNTGKLFQGADTPLTQRGLDQARTVASRCVKLPITALVSSSTKRALQTAEIIGEKMGLSVESVDLFAEVRRPSRLVGRSKDDAEARQMEEAWHRSCCGDGPRVEDGENFDDGKARAGAALTFLENHSADSLLVVTHGLFLRTLFARVVLGENMTGSEFKRIIFTLQSDNTGIFVFTHDVTYAASVLDGGKDVHWRMRVWNDRAHLG
ncbi:hypothetical protein A2851_03930 [Candidatus Kaiserbacteria bacterium RIFCSPHIGHO2_01_FULL_53_29]|uniref:Phosphoglycerate mutase n=1 Tax=Candidatus Kaiserbacteria bacterium RIFCSPHIGHO2_01_FULL_53_29 TaxID=1798480 RepID=A0A1F6CV31_9BACT|nr:MAG: hypothetical protein A2851_03930 [Candidatus Kaiserbacteria bacterium RIFCSPHIGHO2_01_FULL_53_29]